MIVLLLSNQGVNTMNKNSYILETRVKKSTQFRLNFLLTSNIRVIENEVHSSRSHYINNVSFSKPDPAKRCLNHNPLGDSVRLTAKGFLSRITFKKEHKLVNGEGIIYIHIL